MKRTQGAPVGSFAGIPSACTDQGVTFGGVFCEHEIRIYRLNTMEQEKAHFVI